MGRMLGWSTSAVDKIRKSVARKRAAGLVPARFAEAGGGPRITYDAPADGYWLQEGNQPPRSGGKEGHKKYLADFFQTVTKVNGITLHSQTVGDGVSMSEWTSDLVTTNGPILWNEILRRRWQNGKVVSERFYTAQ